MKEIQIGNTLVGEENPCYIVAEIGINHNGDIDIAKKLIDVAIIAGCNAVKFQKRTIDIVYTSEELAKPRESPYGTTNGELKYGLEFEKEEYDEIDRYCKEKKIAWYSSPWDERSVDFMEQYDTPCYKLASASITDDELLKYIKSKGRPIILSTGMSNMAQIDHAVNIVGVDNLILLHACSTYPAYYEELNLNVISVLKQRYNVPVGYSGHETGLPSSVAAKVLGACMIERHITLDRSMWGSDHAASLEPNGIMRLVRDIRLVETSMGDGVKRVIEREFPIMKKLRRVDNAQKGA
jgi:N-acetylneuraminate synthase